MSESRERAGILPFLFCLILPLLLLALILVTTSCEETKEAGKYDNWRARHETFIDSLAGVFAAQTDATPESERLYTYDVGPVTNAGLVAQHRFPYDYDTSLNASLQALETE